MKFTELLFKPNEFTCFGATKFDTAIKPASDWAGEQFYSINPLKGSRADANVTAYRNYLLEFDSGSIAEQMELVNTLQIPYSMITYSGSKSLHVIIALDQSLPDEWTYRAYGELLHRKCPQADRATKNPSRFSRAPGAIRPDTGRSQDLVSLRRTITLAELEVFTGPLPPEPLTNPPSQVFVLSLWANSFLRHGAEPGEWNNKLFSTACEMARLGYTETDIINRCSGITGHLDRLDLKTIKSAVKTCRHAKQG